jgi:hypothetical protein
MQDENKPPELKFFLLRCYHQVLQQSGRKSNSWNQHEIMRYTLEEAIKVAEADSKSGNFLKQFAIDRGDTVKLLELVCDGKIVHSWRKKRMQKKKAAD